MNEPEERATIYELRVLLRGGMSANRPLALSRRELTDLLPYLTSAEQSCLRRLVRETTTEESVRMVSGDAVDLSQLTFAELVALHALRWKLAGQNPEHAQPEDEKCLRHINALAVGQ